MNCPFCGNIMEEGLVQVGTRATWVRKKHWISLLPKTGEVELGRNLMGYCAIPAHICKDCKKVLLDYSQTQPTD